MFFFRLIVDYVVLLTRQV